MIGLDLSPEPISVITCHDVPRKARCAARYGLRGTRVGEAGRFGPHCKMQVEPESEGPQEPVYGELLHSEGRGQECVRGSCSTRCFSTRLQTGSGKRSSTQVAAPLLNEQTSQRGRRREEGESRTSEQHTVG